MGFRISKYEIWGMVYGIFALVFAMKFVVYQEIGISDSSTASPIVGRFNASEVISRRQVSSAPTVALNLLPPSPKITHIQIP